MLNQSPTPTAEKVGSDVWPSMVTHTWNLSSTFNPSKCTLTHPSALVIHSPHRQSLPDLGIEPATFGLQVQLSNH